MSYFSRISTGEVLPVLSTVDRLLPNQNGNRPCATLLGLDPNNRSMVLLRFQDGNIRPTSPAAYDVRIHLESGGTT